MCLSTSDVRQSMQQSVWMGSEVIISPRTSKTLKEREIADRKKRRKQRLVFHKAIEVELHFLSFLSSAFPDAMSGDMYPPFPSLTQVQVVERVEIGGKQWEGVESDNGNRGFFFHFFSLEKGYTQSLHFYTKDENEGKKKDSFLQLSTTFEVCSDEWIQEVKKKERKKKNGPKAKRRRDIQPWPDRL